MTILTTLTGALSSVYTNLNDTSPQTIVDADEAGSWVHGVHVVNVSGSSANLTLDLYQADTSTTRRLLLDEAIASKATHQFEFGFQLNKGWSLRATSSVAGAFDLTSTYSTLNT